MRIALGISYNGHGYCGWQSQSSGNTVQDRLEAALGRFATNLNIKISIPMNRQLIIEILQTKTLKKTKKI